MHTHERQASDSRRSTDGLLTRTELASRLDVHVRTILKWVREGCPVARHGRGREPSLFDERAVREWRAARDEAARQRWAPLEAARARKDAALALESEQRVARRAGVLLDIDTVDRVWSAQVAAVRAALLALPMAIADRIDRVAKLEGKAGVRRVMRKAIANVLRELSPSTSAARARDARRSP
jgi:phage terminase Nu1 subunit (DNA packaging protein)